MADRPARVVLEDVPKIGFWDGGPRCPEDICFPSALRAYLEYLGEDYGCRHSGGDPAWRLGCPYAYAMGVSGAAFFLSWKPGWHQDNVAIHYMSDDPGAPYRRAFEAVGLPFEFVHREDGRDNEAFFRERIVASLRDHARPVLAFGVIGPPEPSIVTGYDEDGEALIGWSFFQGVPRFAAGVEFEPSGYFRKRNWFPDTHSLVVFGEKQPPPPLKDTYREALKWGLQVMRTPTTIYGDRVNGHAAYDMWAAHLARDDEFHITDQKVLNERFAVHDDAIGTVAEARCYGALFLSHAAQQGGAIGYSEPLFAAAACFTREHDLMWDIWNAVGGIGRSDDRAVRLAEPEVRRRIIPIVEEARDRDIEAAAHIERALRAS
jgi:hypothetical protein